jgi:hypothetical protein
MVSFSFNRDRLAEGPRWIPDRRSGRIREGIDDESDAGAPRVRCNEIDRKQAESRARAFAGCIDTVDPEQAGDARLRRAHESFRICGYPIQPEARIDCEPCGIVGEIEAVR